MLQKERKLINVILILYYFKKNGQVNLKLSRIRVKQVEGLYFLRDIKKYLNLGKGFSYIKYG